VGERADALADHALHHLTCLTRIDVNQPDLPASKPLGEVPAEAEHHDRAKRWVPPNAHDEFGTRGDLPLNQEWRTGPGQEITPGVLKPLRLTEIGDDETEPGLVGLGQGFEYYGIALRCKEGQGVLQ
jgi:hypothetical protein